MRLFGYEIKKVPLPVVDEKVTRTVLLPWEVGREVFSPEDYRKLIDLYDSWVYVCASKNANAVAAANIKLYTSRGSTKQKFIVKTKTVDKVKLARFDKMPHLQSYIRKAAEVVEVLEHPIYDVFKNVNPIANRFDLWDATELFLELTGNSYWYIPKNNLGVPDQIWNLPSQYMKIVSDKKSLIIGYVFERGTYKIPFEYDEIIHFKFTSPSNQLYGLGPLAAALQSVSYDKDIRQFDSTLMRNMGRPEAVIEAPTVIGPDVYERVKEEWRKNYSGSAKIGKTIILEQGLTYKPITFPPKDMNHVIGRKMNREEIAAIFGVPMSKLTTESVNLANAKIGETQYQSDTIEPRLRRIEEKLNERFCPMFDERLFLAFDSTVPEDIDFEMRDRTQRLSSYITTVNEEREKLGMEKVEWGDIPLASSSIVPLGSGQQQEPPQEPSFDEDQLLNFTTSVLKKVRKKLIKNS